MTTASLKDPSDLVDVAGRSDKVQLTIPGAKISSAAGLMRGHGTYLEGDSLYSSLAGVVVQTNKLVRVKPVRSRFSLAFPHLN
jgi:exosome complex component RRP4